MGLLVVLNGMLLLAASGELDVADDGIKLALTTNITPITTMIINDFMLGPNCICNSLDALSVKKVARITVVD